MFAVGEIVRFNSKTPNDQLHGLYAIITGINDNRYSYRVRFILSSLEHLHGSVKEEWIDGI